MENPDENSANGLRPDFIQMKTGKFENFCSKKKREIFRKSHPAPHLMYYHLIQFDMSQVKGPLDLSKCHTCPRSQVLLTKLLADWLSGTKLLQKMAKLQAFFFFFTQDCQKILQVTVRI